MAIAFVNVGQVVTLAGPNRGRIGPEMRELAIVENAMVLANEGKIAYVGPYDASLIDRSVTVEDCDGKVLTPGLVDAHTHIVFGGNRANEFEMRASGATYETIAAAGGGIKSSVTATRAESFDDLFDSCQKRLWQAHACGTTAIEIKSGYGLDLESESKMIRAARQAVRLANMEFALTYLGAHAVPLEFEGRKREFLDDVCERVMPAIARYGADEWKGEGMVTWADMFVEKGYFDADDARQYAAAAKANGLKLRLHVDQLTNSGGAALAAELGAKTADHLEQTEADGIAAMAKAGTIPVLLPMSVFALSKSKYPDARAMIDAGLAVVLATDFNPGSSPSPSLPLTMSLACTQMRMTPAEALTACTMNAAASLDLEQSVGSIEIGKKADLVLWDCADWREIPYWIGAPIVSGAWIAGIRVH